jgi:hypothetical protein
MGERGVLTTYKNNKSLPPAAKDYVLRVRLNQKKWQSLGY